MTGICARCQSLLHQGDTQFVGQDGDHLVFNVYHHRNGHKSMQTCPTYQCDEHGHVLSSAAVT